MEDCIFCKIVKKEIPSLTVHEDENTLAIMDIKPLNPGHVLLITKQHARWIWDLNDQMVGKVFSFGNKIANAQRKAFETEWVVCEVMGMGVHHAHIHLVPRFKNDKHKGENLDPTLAHNSPKKDLESNCKKIQKVLEDL